MSSAAAPAAAQVRSVIAVEAAIRPVQVGVMARPGLSPTSLPLMPSSLTVSPHLSAPSVSPTPSAVVLPILSRPSVAVQSSLSLSAAALPSASKADEVRADAAKAVSDWRASRSVPSAAKAPTAPSLSVESPSVQLDALFDGTLPTSREVLSRAASLGLSEASLGRALSQSKSPDDAAARLVSLGVLGSLEAGLAAPDEDEFRFLLTRLWRRTSSSVPSAFEIDNSFGVPALKVERDGVAYFVHAVAHGQLGAPRRGAVLSMVRRVQAAGRALYSEQNLPAHYGYRAGLETLDHAAPGGVSASVVPAAPGYTRETLFIKRAIDWIVSPGSALGALAWAIAAPASVLAWVLLPLLGTLALFTLTGGLPYMAWKRRRRAAAARAEGLEDIAEQYADEARSFFVSKPDLEVLRALELPQPLGAQASDPYSVRSRAIADAVAADAAAKGAAAVHLVVGHLHAHEVAWRLANGPRTEVPGSQIS